MQQLGISIDGNIVNAGKIMKKKYLWNFADENNFFYGAEMKMEKKTPSWVISIDKSIVIGGKARLMKMKKTKKLLGSSIDGKIATTGEDEKEIVGCFY